MIGLGLSLAKLSATLGGVIKKGLQMWLGFTKANVLGKELVVNGNFATGIDGWTAKDGSQAYSNNSLVFTTGSNTGGGPFQDIGLIVGNTYKLTMTMKLLTGSSNGQLGLMSSASNGTSQRTVHQGSILVSGGPAITEAITFTAISGDLSVQPFADEANATYSISNISVKEVAQFAPDRSLNTNKAKLLTGKALEFNGNDYVDLGTTFGLTGEFTVAFWVNLNSYAVVPIGDAGNDDWIRFDSATTMTVKVAGTSTGYAGLPTGGNVPLNQWSRVAITRQSDNIIRFIVNGIIYEPSASVRTGAFDFNRLGVKDGGNFFNGLLSDVQIYNAAWNSDDAAYDYANPNNLATDNPSTSLTLSNLSAHYALSEGSGNIAFDSTGSGAELVRSDYTNATWLSWTAATVVNAGDGIISSTRVDVSDTNLFYAFFTNLLALGYTPNSRDTYELTIDVKIGGIAGSANIGIAAHVDGVGAGKVVSNTEWETIKVPGYVHDGGSDYFRVNAAQPVGVTVFVRNPSLKKVKADNGTGAFLNATPAVIGATWVDKQPTIPQLGMMDWSKGSNLFANSQVFSAWNRGDVSLAANNVTSPIGDLTGSTLTTTENSSTFSISSTVVASTIYTFSFYVKRGTMSDLKYRIYDNSNTNNIVSPTSYYSETSASAWVRVLKTFTTPSGCTSIRTYIISDSASTGTVRIWGSQLEESSTLGSYIGTLGFPASNATLTQNPNDIGKDVLGNSLRLREGGFNLDGSGYAEVADDSTVNPTTAITVQCWIQSNTESNKGLVAKWTNAEKDYMLLKTTSKFKFYIGASNGESGTIPTSGWVNIAGTYDGANIKTYINGVLSTTTSTTGSIPNSTNTLDIGRYNNSQYYSERIDETMVYNRALTQKEIANNHKIGLSKHS